MSYFPTDIPYMSDEELKDNVPDASAEMSAAPPERCEDAVSRKQSTTWSAISCVLRSIMAVKILRITKCRQSTTFHPSPQTAQG